MGDPLAVNVLEADIVKAVPSPMRPAFVRKVLRGAATLPEIEARLPEGRSSIAVRITDDAELRRLNQTFAGEDHATDVLSFSGEGEHLGDLAISWPAVVRQARRYHQTAEAELALLCVHGLLHLLDWDHATPAQNREMTRLTMAALAVSGIAPAARRL